MELVDHGGKRTPKTDTRVCVCVCVCVCARACKCVCACATIPGSQTGRSIHTHTHTHAQCRQEVSFYQSLKALKWSRIAERDRDMAYMLPKAPLWIITGKVAMKRGRIYS